MGLRYILGNIGMHPLLLLCFAALSCNKVQSTDNGRGEVFSKTGTGASAASSVEQTNIQPLSFNAGIATMINGISRSALEPLVNEMTGEVATTLNGKTYTITTRAEGAGQLTRNTEQWFYEHLSSYGVSTLYAPYSGRGTVSFGQNIIGQITGTVNPKNIVVIGCHIDARPWYRTSTTSFGADDDASGCAAVLRLAQLFAGHQFANTIRFAFFNAEENGSWMSTDWGAGYYAAQAKAKGENIVAMISADALAWNPNLSSQIAYMVTRKAGKDPGNLDHAIANSWLQAISTYNITGFQPKIQESGDNLDDHGAFWNAGFPAVMLIEDDLTQVNPNWELLSDRVSTFNWPFYVQLTKSLVATASVLAGYIK